MVTQTIPLRSERGPPRAARASRSPRRATASAVAAPRALRRAARSSSTSVRRSSAGPRTSAVCSGAISPRVSTLRRQGAGLRMCLVNLRLVLEYDGTLFAGWQAQADHRTVEGELRRALRALTGADHVVYAAGRTDAGAHALGQVANFRYEGRLTLDRLRAGLNALLPEDVAVVDAAVAGDDFHA